MANIPTSATTGNGQELAPIPDETGLLDVGAETLPDGPVKRGVGKPRAFTPRQLQNAIDKYFEPFGTELVRVEGDNIRVPTISGLSYSLGIDRQTLIAWSKEKDSEYSSIARACITRLASYWEEYAAVGKSPSGAAFWLRNHGWDGDKAITQVGAESGKDGTLRVVVTVVGGDASGIDV